jgi:hypothetical protein
MNGRESGNENPQDGLLIIGIAYPTDKKFSAQDGLQFLFSENDLEP